MAVLAVSLSMSLGTRWLAQREYEHSNLEQRGAFRTIITNLYGNPRLLRSEDVFGFQQLQEEAVRQKLNTYVFWINLGALLVGGVGSYWFAGRTLRPIEEAHNAQKRFASDASHELRTPLTTIKAENEVFLRQKSFTESDARALIESNLEEVDRLDKLSANLLALTTYESASLTATKLAIRPIIDLAIKQTAKNHPGVSFDVRLAKGRIIGDKASLVQLFGILLDNACKYGPQGEKVSVVGEATQGYYFVNVIDRGKGIPLDDLPYIFDRLFRGDKARSSSVQGHGLGLAIAKRIALKNEAEITAGNQPEGGAIFTVTLRSAT